MKESNARTCEHCLNAYCGFEKKIYCWNKEWEAQFHPMETTVKRDETCGTWSQRKPHQPPLRFNEPIQLQLFG